MQCLITNVNKKDNRMIFQSPVVQWRQKLIQQSIIAQVRQLEEKSFWTIIHALVEDCENSKRLTPGELIERPMCVEFRDLCQQVYNSKLTFTERFHILVSLEHCAQRHNFPLHFVEECQKVKRLQHLLLNTSTEAVPETMQWEYMEMVAARKKYGDAIYSMKLIDLAKEFRYVFPLWLTRFYGLGTTQHIPLEFSEICLADVTEYFCYGDSESIFDVPDLKTYEIPFLLAFATAFRYNTSSSHLLTGLSHFCTNDTCSELVAMDELLCKKCAQSSDGSTTAR